MTAPAPVCGVCGSTLFREEMGRGICRGCDAGETRVYARRRAARYWAGRLRPQEMP